MSKVTIKAIIAFPNERIKDEYDECLDDLKRQLINNLDSIGAVKFSEEPSVNGKTKITALVNIDL